MARLNMQSGERLDQRSPVSGLTEPMVRSLIQAFYARVKKDPLLGPLFRRAIGEDWSEHIERITLFWLTATRLRRGYNGRNFMPAHLRHSFIRADQLPHWLKLFKETCEQERVGDAADVLIDVAERMAENLRISLEARSPH